MVKARQLCLAAFFLLGSTACAGRQKAAAILGAVRGGYVKSLVTDDVTAMAVLALARSLADGARAREDACDARAGGRSARTGCESRAVARSREPLSAGASPSPGD